MAHNTSDFKGLYVLRYVSGKETVQVGRVRERSSGNKWRVCYSSIHGDTQETTVVEEDVQQVREGLRACADRITEQLQQATSIIGRELLVHRWKLA